LSRKTERLDLLGPLILIFNKMRTVLKTKNWTPPSYGTTDLNLEWDEDCPWDEKLNASILWNHWS